MIEDARTTLPPFAVRDPRDIADPYPLYRRYRELDPVHVVPPTDCGGPASWHLFRYDDVAHVLAGRHFGRSAGVARVGQASAPPLVPPDYPVLSEMVANWLVFLDPPRHTRLRSLILKEFSPRVVGRLRGRIAEIASELVDGMREKAVTDLVADFSAPLPILVICELL